MVRLTSRPLRMIYPSLGRVRMTGSNDFNMGGDYQNGMQASEPWFQHDTRDEVAICFVDACRRES